MFTLIDEPYPGSYAFGRESARTFTSEVKKKSVGDSAKEIGDRIKRFAKEMYGSQTAFAEAIGRSTGQVGDWVAGRKVPGGDALKDFRAVKMSIDWLLSGEGEMLVKPPTYHPTDMSGAQDFDADRDTFIETMEEYLARFRRMREQEKAEEEKKTTP